MLLNWLTRLEEVGLSGREAVRAVGEMDLRFWELIVHCSYVPGVGISMSLRCVQ